MSLHELVRHPDTPSAAIERVEVMLEREERDARGLTLTYRLLGDAARVVTEPPAPCASSATPAPCACAAAPAPRSLSRRRDELWRSTCCELFLGDAHGAGYREYNFAPCGDWAAYRFDGYRAHRVPLETRAPRVTLERSPGAVTLAVTVTLSDALVDGRGRRPRIGLACVVETDTELSYWALAHPPGRPDFHHASAFALTFAAEPAAHSGA